MITDKNNSFGFPVSLNTGAAGSYLLGDVIPLMTASDRGESSELYLVIVVTDAATSAGAATAKFSLVTDDVEAIATDGSATVHLETAAIPVADMVLGYSVLTTKLPLEGQEYETYMGLLQTTGTAAFTAGAVKAFLTPSPANWKAYAEGNN
jgi:hypothetical protein